MALSAEVIEGFVTSLLSKHFDEAAETPDFHREMWTLCTSSSKFVAIAAPRGHAKSTCISLAYVLANICFREAKFVVLLSDTEAQSTYFVGNIKKELMENEDLRTLFGIEGLAKETEQDIIIKFKHKTEDGWDEARIIAKGAEQKMRGLLWNNTRPDLIVGDDMENDEIVLNKERREKFRRWFTGAVVPSLSKSGKMRLVGTILHMDSLLERYMPKPWKSGTEVGPLRERTPYRESWQAIKYRAHPTMTDFSQVLWPEYKDAAWLKYQQSTYLEQGLGDVYAQEFLNQPIDDTNALFKRQYFKAIKREEGHVPLHYYITFDLAVTETTRSDYTVFAVFGIDAENRIHVIEVFRERQDTLQSMEMVLDLQRKYEPMFFVCEKGAITNSVLPQLRKRMAETNVWPLLHILPNNKDKVSKTATIRARMAQGMVYFDKEADWYTALEQECIRFPRDRHDDMVDTLGLLGQALDKLIEAPTRQEIADQAWEDEMEEGLTKHQDGRSLVTGY